MFKANKFLAIIVLFLFVVIMGSCGGGGGGGGNGGTQPPPSAENFTLTVEKFGEGVIIDNQSGINCGANCSKTYPKDTTFVLTATAGSGSVFKSWAGCDSVVDNTCTVTMNSNKTITTTFALSEFKYQPTTKVLDDSTMQHLVKQEGTIYYFDSQATIVKDLRAGDVIMSSSDKDLLRRVTAVSIQPDGLIAVETTDATLEDAIEKGTISFTEKLTHAQLKSSGKLIRGVRLHEALKPESVDFTFFIDTTIYDDAGNSVKVTGSVTTNFEPDFALTIDWEGLRPKLKEFKSILITKNTQSLSVAGSINLIDKKVRLTTAPIIWVVPTQIGPVTIEGDLYLGIKGAVTATTKASTEVIYTAGIYYKTETDWKTVNAWSRKVGSIDIAPSASATASVKPYIRPELKILLWKTVGSYANMDGYFKLEAGISSSPWWELYGGVDASIGANMEIISWTVASVGFNFNIVEWEIASSTTQNQSPIIASVTATPSSVSPNGTSTVTCVASDPDNDPLTYSWSATGGTVTGSGTTVTWTAPSTAGTYTVTCTVSDGKEGGSASKGVDINVSTSTLPAPTGLTATPKCDGSTPGIELQWSAVSGATKYEIYRNGNLIYTTSTSTPYFWNTSGLTAGQSYQYQVKAKNDTTTSDFSNTATAIAPTNCGGDTVPPSIPSGLTAAAVSSSQINLSWNASTDNIGVTGYKIYDWTGTFLKSATSTSTSFTGLTPNTNYCFTASAYDAAGNESGKSNQACATTLSSGYSISGRVTLNGSGLSGVTITLTGTGSTTASTGSDGSYTFTGAQNGSYTITPSKSGYMFTPSSRSITVNNANVTGQDFTATQTTTGVLSVSPSDGLVSSGPQGGPFSPSSKTYTLSNTGGSSINWTASKGQSWVSLSATSSTLSPGGSTTVTVSINSNANSLSPGNYVDTVSFTNTTNGNGNTTRTVNLTVTGSTAVTPSISSVSPNPVTGSNSQQPFTIYGNNFVSGANVTLRDLTTGEVFPNRVASSFSSTQIVLTPIFTTAAHNWSVEVINPDGKSSGQFYFQVVAPAASAPTISSVSPNPVTGSNSQQPFTIYGNNFVSGANVTLRDLTTGEVFPNRVASSFSSTQIVLTPIFTTAAHNWSVEVINPDGKSSGQFYFNVVAPPAPSISSISPNPVPGLNGSQTLTIYGGNFQSGLTVRLTDTTYGGTYDKAPTSFSSSHVTISANFTNTAAIWTVQIINPGGASSNLFYFQVVKQ